MRNNIALITGITGQTGSYVCELLLERGFEVHGIVRRSSSISRARIDHLTKSNPAKHPRIHLHYADFGDPTTLRRIILGLRPQYIFHLAGQSHVGLSFLIPESTCREITSATLTLLEICRDLDEPPHFYHASSSEVFGIPHQFPQTESTPFRPVNPYGCAKAFATNICQVYRSAYSLPVSNGILYNHESPRRGENFITRKICIAAASHAHGSTDVIDVGNLDSARDWGYALEYAEAILRISFHSEPSDYIIATGIPTTVRQFAIYAYRSLGIDLRFDGIGESESAYNSTTGQKLLAVNPSLYRPVDTSMLVGDSTKAKTLLGWIPEFSAEQLACLMADAEFKRMSTL